MHELLKAAIEQIANAFGDCEEAVTASRAQLLASAESILRENGTLEAIEAAIRKSEQPAVAGLSRYTFHPNGVDLQVGDLVVKSKSGAWGTIEITRGGVKETLVKELTIRIGFRKRVEVDMTTWARPVDRLEELPADATEVAVCGCRDCIRRRGLPEPMRMIVCPKCGNKRCPHAGDHRFRCTYSNAPNQIPEVAEDGE